MGRFLILVLVVVAIVWLLRRASGGGRARAEAAQAGAAAQGDLVRCAHCGVNLPSAEALLAGDRIYCSEEHRRLGPRGG